MSVYHWARGGIFPFIVVCGGLGGVCGQASLLGTFLYASGYGVLMRFYFFVVCVGL